MSCGRNGNGTPAPPARRCAIYTRKSTSEGLDQEFNSLDAQREACERYIAARKHEGSSVVEGRYDDGGFTGANLDRPAFQRLMADVEARRLDVVVVYKVDRLSRSLLDFAQVMDRFNKADVASSRARRTSPPPTPWAGSRSTCSWASPSSSAR